MKFEIFPYKSAGIIKLGMTPDEVRRILGSEYRTFGRSSDCELPSDHFIALGVLAYYKTPGFLDAVEFTTPAEPIFQGRNLLDMSFNALKEFLIPQDQDLEIDTAGLTSRSLGIGAYAPFAKKSPNDIVEAIIVFERGYYDRP